MSTHLVQIFHIGSQKAAGKRLHIHNAGVLVVVLCSFLTHGVIETKLAIYLHCPCLMMQVSERFLLDYSTDAETYDEIRQRVDVWQSNDVFLPSHILVHDGLQAGRSESCPPLNRLR